MSRRLAGRLLLLLVAMLAALLLGELVLRLLRPATSAYSVAATGNQYHFYQFDPQLGWANTPLAHGTFARDEFRYEVAINAHGMRQAEVSLAKPAGLRRIAVLGDSFVWGIGVADADRTTEQLAQRLDGVEVLNFGVSGYGPLQHLLSLDRVLAFAPDLVVVLFCLGNDFVDDVQSIRYGYPKPYAERDAAGELRIAGLPLPATGSFGFTARPRWLGSELLGAVRQLLVPAPAASAPRGLTLLDEAAMYDTAATGERQAQRLEAFAIDALLLARLHEQVRAAGRELLVVPAPTKFEYHPRGTTGHEGVFPVLEQALQQNCARLGIPFLPMVANLHGDDFWRLDGHWNVGGHRKVAEAIAAHLATRGFRRRDG